MSGDGSSLPMRRPSMVAPLDFRMCNGRSNSRALITCPNCCAPCYIRDSARVTETFKKLTVHCTNTACMAAFSADISITMVLNPGLELRADLDLPIREAAQVPHVMPPKAGHGDPDQISMFTGDG